MAPVVIGERAPKGKRKGAKKVSAQRPAATVVTRLGVGPKQSAEGRAGGPKFQRPSKRATQAVRSDNPRASTASSTHHQSAPCSPKSSGASGKSAAASTVNNTLRQLVLKQPVQRDKWIDKYENELGIRPIRLAIGGVKEDRCKFCETFGKEDAAEAVGVAVFSPLMRSERKKTDNVKIFWAFRRDNLIRHLELQHPAKWKEFTSLPLEGEERRSFFRKKTTVAGFMPNADGFQLVIPTDIVAVIQRLFCKHSVETNKPDAEETDSIGASASNDEGDEQFSLDGELSDGLVDAQPSCSDADDLDRGMLSAVFIELDDRTLAVSVSDRLQFETVIRCVNASGSFRGISRLFVIFGEGIGSMRLGKPNERVVGQYVRSVVAIALVALRTILSAAWGFTIMVDGATHASEGYFDTRVSLEFASKVYNFHLMAIPMGDRSHTAQMYADLVLDLLESAFGSSVLKKLTGVASDGAATMLGCRQGFALRIRQACSTHQGGEVAVNWRGSHQLNLAVGKLVEGLNDAVGFRSRLGAEISCTRKYDTIRTSVGQCPTYASTRWDSTHTCCCSLADQFEALTRAQEEKGIEKSSDSWWLSLFAVVDMTEQIKHCFKRLQYKTVTMKAQQDALQRLLTTFQMKYESGANGAAPTLSSEKVKQHIRCASFYSIDLFDGLSIAKQERLVAGVKASVKAFMDAVARIEIEVGREVPVLHPTTPLQIIQCDAGAFRDAVYRHAERLRSHFGTSACSDIWKQRNNLVQLYEESSSIRGRVDDCGRHTVEEMWAHLEIGPEFQLLVRFAVGLSAISLGTHTVESDFSCLKRAKNIRRASLSNYALEGQLHAQQYFELIGLAESVGTV